MRNHATVRSNLLERVADARRHSDALFGIVQPASLYDRPIPERHRIIFYVGHLEAFDWNLLHESVFGLRSFHPEFDRLFAFGIDPVDGGLPSDRPSDWPSLGSVRDYVTRIRFALDEKLERIQDAHTDTRDKFSLDTLLNVAIEHRLMHVETLAYMLHRLPLDRKARQAALPIVAGRPVGHRMVEIPEGLATLGLARGGDDFGWDNEYEAQTAHVPAFEIDQYKVTNGQYLDFIAAGGYETRAYWREEDWNWRAAQNISHPAFWKRTGDAWLLRAMFEEIPMPLDWPVYVSQAEAAAYAQWAGKSLPTEEQWHRAAYGTADDTERTYRRPCPWGDAAPDRSLGNFDFQRWDPAPVNAFPQGRSAFGVNDLLGNGWEWTSSKFSPFPGFEPFPFYRGYSADFFDGKHFVMKGGSARTAACMLRPTFRNWFQPHYQCVYAGFRCASH
ncbi:MAG: SUMF1/EgtB/PvdO family nonheme iron enzyme [Terriglobales bacterium]